MSIKLFRRVVFGIAFEHALKDDALGTVGDMFGGRQYLYAVVFERLLVNRRFIFIAGKTVKLVNCHIFLWTVFCDSFVDYIEKKAVKVNFHGDGYF